VLTLNVNLNLKLGSSDFGELLEVFSDENVNKESVAECLNIMIIDNSWEIHYWEISVMIVVTRIVPLLSLIILILLKENEFSLRLNLISSSIVLAYEFLQMYQISIPKYFKSALNWFDLFGHIACVIWVIANMMSDCHNEEEELCL
jgi:hypothetical protein